METEKAHAENTATPAPGGAVERTAVNNRKQEEKNPGNTESQTGDNGNTGEGDAPGKGEDFKGGEEHGD